MQSGEMLGRRSLQISFGVYTALLLVLTLGSFRQRLPGSQADNGVLSLQSWLSRETWSTGWSVEFFANVAVFVLWGALAAAVVGRRFWCLAALGGGALSLVIEVLQISTARISDPRDLVANALGTVIGVTFMLLITTPMRGNAREQSAG